MMDLVVVDDEPAETATKREGPAPLHVEVPSLERGSLVGRYVILDILGEGGMGIVYRAYDPELDRKVAIKLLQAGSGGSTSAGGQAWLVREAQAMARLSHPNVIAVHDVGTLPGDRVFVAMELVDGMTLRDWLRERPRTWREVVPVLRAAGAGLAAAHAVDLVHRDFKPDNVLVGHDGRVRVMDFGLARLRPEDDASPESRKSDQQIEVHSPLSQSLTEIGTVLGTPAYMAPEIYDGLGAGPRSDQFAFGVALYEALYRERPFSKKALMPPRTPPPKPKHPPDLGVPARIQRVVMRTIALDPEARYPSMAEVLDELAIDPHATRRLAIAAVAVLALGGLAAGGFVMARQRDPLCKGIERRLAGVWDTPAKLSIHLAFATTKKPYAESSYAGLERALDGYVGEWTEAAVGNCEATRIRGEQSEEVQTLRQGCLDQRLEELRALSQILATATASLVEKGDKAVWELEPIKRCANVDVLRQPSRPAPEVAARYNELLKQMAVAKAQAIGGQLLPALTGASAVLDGAHEIHSDGLASEALLVRGGVMLLVGNPQEARKILETSTWAAMRSRRDDMVAQASLSAALAITASSESPQLAQMWIDLSDAAAIRVGIDRQLEQQRLEAQGIIQAQRGELVAAVETHKKSLEAAQRVYGVDGPATWEAEEMLSATMGKAGGWVLALPHLEHALALREASVGPEHPDVALILSNLGACYDHAGDETRALATFQRALALREKIYGAGSPMLVATLNNLADFKSRNHDISGALEYILRAKAIAVKVPGPTSSLYHVVATTEAEILTALGRFADARAAFDATIELETKAQSIELPTTLASRGALEFDAGKWASAASYDERSIAAYEAIGGKDHLEMWRPLAALADARRKLDPKADVKPLLERAVEIANKAQVKESDLAPIRDALAKLH